MSDGGRECGDERHGVLADLFCGLTADELIRLREDVQFGRVSPPIVVEIEDDTWTQTQASQGTNAVYSRAAAIRSHDVSRRRLRPGCDVQDDESSV